MADLCVSCISYILLLIQEKWRLSTRPLKGDLSAVSLQKPRLASQSLLFKYYDIA